MSVVAECFIRRCKYYKGIFNRYNGRSDFYDPKVFHTCNAFPKGIPPDVIEGKNKHDRIIKGQTGCYLFEKMEQ